MPKFDKNDDGYISYDSEFARGYTNKRIDLSEHVGNQIIEYVLNCSSSIIVHPERTYDHNVPFPWGMFGFNRLSDYVHYKHHNDWAVEFFRIFADEAEWEQLFENREKLEKKLAEYVSSLPASTLFEDLMQRVNEYASFFYTEDTLENQTFFYHRENTRNAAGRFLNWLYQYEDREKIDFFQSWYGFYLPTLMYEIFEKNPTIENRDVLSFRLMHRLNELGIEPVDIKTPGQLMKQLKLVVGVTGANEIKELLALGRKGHPEHLRQAVIISPNRMSGSKGAFAREAAAEAMSHERPSRARYPETGGKAKKPAKPRGLGLKPFSWENEP